jgi:hypothetical protein
MRIGEQPLARQAGAHVLAVELGVAEEEDLLRLELIAPRGAELPSESASKAMLRPPRSAMFSSSVRVRRPSRRAPRNWPPRPGSRRRTAAPFWPALAVAGGRLWPTSRWSTLSWPSSRTSGCRRRRHQSRGRDVPASMVRERQRLERRLKARRHREGGGVPRGRGARGSRARRHGFSVAGATARRARERLPCGIDLPCLTLATGAADAAAAGSRAARTLRVNARSALTGEYLAAYVSAMV